jgi:hypothetical protein
MEVKILMSRSSAYKIATDSGTEHDEMQHSFAPKKNISLSTDGFYMF